MKYKDCPAYDKNTETIKKEIGSARGEILYKESEIILSERYLNEIETLEYYERNLQKENINIKRMAFELFYNRHYKDCKIIIFERKLDLTEAVRMKKDYIEKIEPIFN